MNKFNTKSFDSAGDLSLIDAWLNSFQGHTHVIGYVVTGSLIVLTIVNFPDKDVPSAETATPAPDVTPVPVAQDPAPASVDATPAA